MGGLTLDSHHGFVVEYGVNRDIELGRCLLYNFLLIMPSVSMNNNNLAGLLYLSFIIQELGTKKEVTMT